jgi:hypothetical protein
VIGAIAATRDVIARLIPMARFLASTGIRRSKMINWPRIKPALVMPPHVHIA